MNIQISHLHYFERAKWPDGFRCLRCGFHQACMITTRRQPLYQCRRCRHQSSLTSGTIMAGSKTPLAKWHKALQLMASPRGINAVQLHRAISVTYKTAWLMLNKVRRAISRFDSEQPLTGEIRMYTAIYGYTRGSCLRPYRVSRPMLVATGQSTKQMPCYIKIKTAPSAFMHKGKVSSALLPMLLDTFTDIQTSQCAIVASAIIHSSQDGRELASTAITAKQWIRRLYRAVGSTYVQQYWNEFSFRTNMRRCSTHGGNEQALFQQLATLCSRIVPQ